MQNLKVDIIYHQSPSDFEMEFNMRGNCPIRLLSDKTTDKKGFVKALARDVARSRVIICCGPLFGSDGLINIVAKAIGTGVMPCNNKTYGINSEETIHIINGSTPLVTPDGYFGGCIIESGPQTIVLLTENKSFRKTILKNLIHPYLLEISYIALPSASIPAPVTNEEPVFETAVSENETYVTGSDDYEIDAEETQPLPVVDIQDEHNLEFVMDEEEGAEEQSQTTQLPTENIYNDLYIEPETPEETKARYEHPYTTSESDNIFISEREVDETEEVLRKKSNIRAMDITIVLLVTVLLLAILALVYLIVLRPVSMGVSTGEYIKEIFGLADNSLV